MGGSTRITDLYLTITSFPNITKRLGYIMNPNRSWLIKMKKEKNFKMIFFSIKRNMNISRKIREISLLRKIAYESNFFYACDKYCFLFIRVYVQERRNVATRETHTKVPSRRKSRKNIERWSLHKGEGKSKSGTSFVSSLFRIRDRAETWRHSWRSS